MRERRLNRLRDYDYSQAGGYFITRCTYNREYLFGEIINQEMMLNYAGRIVREWWVKLEKKFSSVKLDDYVIMPNHTHGIITIVEGEGDDVGAIHELSLQEGVKP